MTDRTLCLLCLLTAAAWLSPTPTRAQGPTDAEIQAAIATGTRDRIPLALRLGAEAGAAGFVCGAAARESVCAFTISVQGPLGRIQTLAADAAKRYLPFTIDSVTDAMRAAVMIVRATPAPPLLSGRLESHAPAATHIVLIPVTRRGDPEPVAVQPLTVSTFPVEWANRVGGKWTGQGVTAIFALEALPIGDFYVVVVTTTKEARYPIQAKNRAAIR